MKTLRIWFLFLLSILLYSCGKNDGVAPSSSLVGLSISPNAVTLAAGNLVTFTASGGSGSYSYSIFSGGGSVLSTTGNFTAAHSAGTTVVRVVDGSGLYADAIVTTNASLQISPTTQSLSINGVSTFSASGGVPPVKFSLASGLGSVNPNSGVYTAGSSAGASIVRATDAVGNTSDATVNVFAGLGISPTSITVAVNNTVSFSAGGGSAPYTFSVFSGSGVINASSGLFTAAASSGSVTVRVTDNLGNHSDAIVTVNPGLAISPGNQILNVNDTLTYSVNDGVPPYTFSISSGTGSVNAASGQYTAPAANGSAVVLVTDTYGNTASANVTITTPLSLSPTSKILAVNNNFTFTGSGGTLPLVYSVIGVGSINSSSGAYTAPGSSGAATIRVTDALGATADASVTINPLLTITPSAQTMTVNSGLSFSSSGGVVPYTYSRVSGNGSVNSSSGAYTAPASPGTDVIRVTDSFGNTSDATITINNNVGISPAAITLAVNNTVTFSAVNGTGPFSFSKFSGGGAIASGTGLFTAPATSGTTIIRVTDSLNNTADATVTINPALAISPATKTLAVNNVFTFSASGGVTPYSYSVTSGTGSVNSSTGQYTAPASSGSNTLRVTDAYGNISNATVTITNALAISPASATITTVDTKTFTSSGGVSPYTYSVFSGGGAVTSATGIYTPSSTGVKIIRSTDAFGNISDATLTVNTVLAISPSSAYVTVDDDYDFSYSGGVDPIVFTVIGNGTIDSASGLYTADSSPGTDTVRATDALGHTSNSSVTIYNGLSISPLSVTKGVNATQSFSGSGGVGALTYSIYSGNGTINSSSGLYTAPSSAGTDVVQVSDTIGNSVTATVSVVNTLTISPQTLKLPVFSTATFSAVLGTAPYTYSVAAGTGSINSGTGLYTAASSIGSGTVRVTDNASITSDAAVTHIEPVALDSGAYHTCVLYNEGSVKCWGRNNYGQLGQGHTATLGDSLTEGGGNLPFVNLGTGRTATAIAVGTNHSCALLDNASVKCWGRNNFGQLGQGSTSSLGDGPGEMGDSLPAINLGSGKTATAIYAFGSISCAVLNDGSTKCWGINTYGELGLGDVNNRGDAANEMGDNLPAVNFGTALTPVKIVGGLDYMCALLSNAKVKCYGRANTGQLGAGNTNSLGDSAGEVGDAVPFVDVGSSRTVVAISATYSHTCVILDNSTMKCWGTNNNGQLGQGNTTQIGDTAGEMGDSLPAIALGTGFVPVKVYTARLWTCALSAAGALKCFGLGTSGQLLRGNTTNYGDGANEMGDNLVAASLGTGFSVAKLSVGYYFGCTIGTDKHIKCWGKAANGALLNGSTTQHLGDSPGELGDGLPYVNH